MTLLGIAGRRVVVNVLLVILLGVTEVALPLHLELAVEVLLTAVEHELSVRGFTEVVPDVLLTTVDVDVPRLDGNANTRVDGWRMVGKGEC